MYGHSTPRRKSAWLSLLTGVLLCALLLLLSPALTGCDSNTDGSGSGFATVTDDNGNTVTIAAKPLRIVSASPAATQILFALGAGDRVVGVNKWDEYPAEVLDLPKVADMQVNTEAVMALDPDLVLGAAGQEEPLATLQAAGTPVLFLNPTTVEGIYDDITSVGKAVGADDKATEVIESMRATIVELSEAADATGATPTVFYAVDDTLFTCGPGSFVDELLTLASATNVASLPEAGGDAAQGYFQFAPEQLVAADPQIVLLSGLRVHQRRQVHHRPPLRRAHRRERGPRVRSRRPVRQAAHLAAPRIVEGFGALVRAIHPEVK